MTRRLVVALLLCVAAVSPLLLVALFARTPDCPLTTNCSAVGCEYRWAGPVTGWVLVSSECPANSTCSPPAAAGTFVGETQVTPCQMIPPPPPPGVPSPSCSCKPSCDCKPSCGCVSACGCGQSRLP